MFLPFFLELSVLFLTFAPNITKQHWNKTYDPAKNLFQLSGQANKA